MSRVLHSVRKKKKETIQGCGTVQEGNYVATENQLHYRRTALRHLKDALAAFSLFCY